MEIARPELKLKLSVRKIGTVEKLTLRCSFSTTKNRIELSPIIGQVKVTVRKYRTLEKS